MRPGRRRCPARPPRPHRTRRPVPGRALASARPGRRALPPRFRPGLRLRRLQRQLILRGGGAEPPQHRGRLHLQAAGDLRIADPGRPPFPRPLPRARIQLARPAPRPDHPAGPLSQRPVMQRRHVVHRQAHHGGHRLPAIAQLPQHRHRHVARPGVVVPVAEQQPRPGQDQLTRGARACNTSGRRRPCVARTCPRRSARIRARQAWQPTRSPALVVRRSGRR